jgi:DNA polymerase III delta subunit
VLVQAAAEPLDGDLARRATAVAVEPLPPARVERWMAHRAQQLGLTLAPEAGELLLATVGSDLAALAGELEKVAAAVGTRPASREDVAELVGVRSDATLQDYVDAVCERRAAAAARLVAPVLEQPGMSGVRMLGALGTNLVGTALARAERDRSTPDSRIEDVLLTHLRAARPYGLGSWERTAASWARWAELWRAPELERALRLALAADRALKSGTLSDEAAILADLVLSLGAARREAA